MNRASFIAAIVAAQDSAATTPRVAADQTPNRAVAKGTGVRVCAAESRPAVGADLTDSLTARTDEKGHRPRGARAVGGTHQTPLSRVCAGDARAGDASALGSAEDSRSSGSVGTSRPRTAAHKPATKEQQQ